jgi:hypothetical protein
MEDLLEDDDEIKVGSDAMALALSPRYRGL